MLGPSTIAGTLNVTAAGNITSSGALDVTGDATFTAGSATGQSIILSKAGNTFDGTVTFAQSSKTLDAITFVNDIAGSTDYTLPAKVVNLTLTQNGKASGVELETVNVTNDLTVTATGNVTQSGALTVGNTATIATATTANVVLTKATNAFNTVAVTQAKDVTLTDTNAIVLGASTVSGSLTVTAGEAITDSGALSVTNTATFETAADKNITLDNANNFNKVVVTKANDVNLNDTSAIVLGASTISGDFSVTAAEAVTQSGALSVTNGTTTIATNAAKNVDLSKASNDFATVGITSANDVSLQDANAIDLAASTVSGGLAVTAGGDISDSGALTITGATVLNTPGNNVVLDEAANDFSSIQITSGAAATIVDQNQLTVNASTLTTSSSFSSSDIDIGGTLTGAGTLTLNANASATSYGVGDATGNDYTVSSADLNNLVGWSNIDFTSAGNVPIEVAGTIDPSSSADLQFTASVLNVENTATIGGGVSNLVTVNAPTITGSNGVTTGNLTVSRNLTFTGGTISLNSLVTNQAVTLGSTATDIRADALTLASSPAAQVTGTGQLTLQRHNAKDVSIGGVGETWLGSASNGSFDNFNGNLIIGGDNVATQVTDVSMGNITVVDTLQSNSDITVFSGGDIVFDTNGLVQTPGTVTLVALGARTDSTGKIEDDPNSNNPAVRAGSGFVAFATGNLSDGGNNPFTIGGFPSGNVDAEVAAADLTQDNTGVVDGFFSSAVGGSASQTVSDIGEALQTNLGAIIGNFSGGIFVGA